MPPRYVIGIDLGTTNCALAVIDTAAGEEAVPEVQNIPQLVAPGEIRDASLLPSFLFVPGPNDFPAGSTSLPWDREPPFVVGELARRRGAENPARLVASAKSWLSHPRVDRTGAILPQGAGPEVSKLSPVEASAAYLRHLGAAWNAAQVAATVPLSQQDVLVTVPASFDAVARELTLRGGPRRGARRRDVCSRSRRPRSTRGSPTRPTAGASWCTSAT